MRELTIKHTQQLQSETVLVMQGGGSLGAYECGVYKALAKRGIKFDIVAGTSIGAVNAAIIAAPKNSEPAKDLENFWLEIAETITPSVLPDNMRVMVSSMIAATYGNAKAFSPLWWWQPMINRNSNNNFSFFSYKWPYLYDTMPLKNTLSKYVDFAKLNNNPLARLIVTSTDIQRSAPVIFDSASMNIDADHIIACTGFPFYGIAWTQKDGKYLWDGSLLSNTPLREVIHASPKNSKKVYIVNLFPCNQEELPENMFDAWHRARDIIHTDKTYHNIRMSKVISKYLLLLKEMHDIISNAELDGEMKERFLKIEKDYHKIADERGAIIQEITRIERTEEIHHIFEDADFSITTVRKLIKQGEEDTEKILSMGKERDSKEKP